MRLLCVAFIVCIAQAAGPTPMMPARLAFEANSGQAEPGFQFLARARGYSVAISANETAIRAGSAQVRLQFVGSRPFVLEGLDQLPGVVNYLIGKDSSHWLRGIPTYARIRGRNLYPGVDIVFHGTGSRLEYDFALAPGADASRIGLKFTGAQRVRVDEQGDLVLDTAAGELRQRKPLIYQERNGRREIVDGRYRITGDGQVAVNIPRYDRRRPLLIDPELVYAVPVGTGSGGDQVNAIATDSQGNTYITGQTGSADFPVRNALQGPAVTLYRSDAGGPFTPLQSVGSSVTMIAVEPSNSAIAYILTTRGLFKTTDAGAHATLLPLGLPAGSTITAMAIDPSNVATVYVAAYAESGAGLGVYKTIDGGADWTAIDNGLNGPQGSAVITQLYVDPTQPSHLFAEKSGGPSSTAFRSDDGGATWVPGSLSFFSLTFDPNHPGTVYACTFATATTGAAIYKSTDGGNTWSMLGPQNTNDFAIILAIDPFHPGTLWAGDDDGVYKSADGGQTWSETALQAEAHPLAADPVVPNTFYAAAQGGIYKTSDGGATWARFGPSGVSTFAIAPDERMYAGASFAVKAFVTKLDPTGQNILYSTYISADRSTSRLRASPWINWATPM
jgi:photosystem II stability/assembly factor-like uncharacterized protein